MEELDYIELQFRMNGRINLRHRMQKELCEKEENELIKMGVIALLV